MFSFVYFWGFWVVMALVFFVPVGYGWGYRGWGAPYPSYIQRRRLQRATMGGASPTVEHGAWGRAGDFIWALIFFDLVFFSVVLLWR